MITFRTEDSPDANRRQPQPGDIRWRVELPLEDGEKIQIYMGQKSRDILFGMLIADCHDSGEVEPG